MIIDTNVLHQLMPARLRICMGCVHLYGLGVLVWVEYYRLKYVYLWKQIALDGTHQPCKTTRIKWLLGLILNFDDNKDKMATRAHS